MPGGVAAEGGWATAYQEVKASLAECAEVAAGESAGGGSHTQVAEGLIH